MEEKCLVCDKSEGDVKLLDAVSGNEMVKICEECSLVENLPIIRRPTTSQLKESEKPYTVKERLRRMAGLHAEEKAKVSKIAKDIMNVTLDSLRKKKTKEEELEDKFKLAKKRNISSNLVNNFHWHILMARKKKKLTRGQLADLIGESETAIKMIENKEVPDDYLTLIRKLEQFFGIKLREGEKVEEKKVTSELVKEEPAMILKLDKENVKNLTIADLRKMRDEKQVGGENINVADLIWQVDKEEQEKSQEKEGFVGDGVEFE